MLGWQAVCNTALLCLSDPRLITMMYKEAKSLKKSRFDWSNWAAKWNRLAQKKTDNGYFLNDKMFLHIFLSKRKTVMF